MAYYIQPRDEYPENNLCCATGWRYVRRATTGSIRGGVACGSDPPLHSAETLEGLVLRGRLFPLHSYTEILLKSMITPLEASKGP